MTWKSMFNVGREVACYRSLKWPSEDPVPKLLTGMWLCLWQKLCWNKRKNSTLKLNKVKIALSYLSYGLGWEEASVMKTLLRHVYATIKGVSKQMNLNFSKIVLLQLAATLNGNSIIPWSIYPWFDIMSLPVTF